MPIARRNLQESSSELAFHADSKLLRDVRHPYRSGLRVVMSRSSGFYRVPPTMAATAVPSNFLHRPRGAMQEVLLQARGLQLATPKPPGTSLAQINANSAALTAARGSCRGSLTGSAPLSHPLPNLSTDLRQGPCAQWVPQCVFVSAAAPHVRGRRCPMVRRHWAAVELRNTG